MFFLRLKNDSGLYIFFLSLHWINDLPGALRQVRLNLQVQVEHLPTFNHGK